MDVKKRSPAGTGKHPGAYWNYPANCKDVPAVAGSPNNNCKDVPAVAGSPNNNCKDVPVIAGSPNHNCKDVPVIAGSPNHNFKDVPAIAGSPNHNFKDVPAAAGSHNHNIKDVPASSQDHPKSREDAPAAVSGGGQAKINISTSKKGGNAMSIKALPLEKMRNDAHFQYQTEFRTLVTGAGAESLKIGPQFAEWEPLYAIEDEALKKIVKSEFTAKIQDADKARDDTFTGISEISRACLKHHDPDIRAAAGRLKILLGTYGNIYKKPLQEQTSAIGNILQELKGKYAPDAAAAGISAWVAELEKRNGAFAALTQERFDEAAARTGVTMAQARAGIDKQYRAIVQRINALIIVEGLEAYEPFVNRLNVVIDKYAAALARQKGRGGKKEDSGESAEQNNVLEEDGDNSGE
jgi:hypothetical protein